MGNDELHRRALAAYFKMGGQDQPNAAMSGVATVKGLKYVVLQNIRGTLAVYRVKNDGALRRMKRWPSKLEK
jgi:hypothetical protein